MRIFTSREFNQDHGRVKQAARQAPVCITERGEPTYVLLSQAEYERLSRKRPTLLDLLADSRPEADLDFDPDGLEGGSRGVDF